MRESRTQLVKFGKPFHQALNRLENEIADRVGKVLFVTRLRAGVDYLRSGSLSQRVGKDCIKDTPKIRICELIIWPVGLNPFECKCVFLSLLYFSKVRERIKI